MLEDKDRIFKNLYNDNGADLESAKLRGDWSNTKELCAKGKGLFVAVSEGHPAYHRWH